jgi:uncharacterized phage protein (TIGR01671 family)
MREIKFRAWLIKEKLLTDVLEWYSNGRVGIAIHDSGPFLKQPEDVVLEQFTGLNDMDGNDIYEGDICKLSINPNSDNYMGQIGMSNFTSVARVEYASGVYLFVNLTKGKAKKAWARKTIGRHEIEVIEVIGNIHENPELLS